MSCHLLEYVHAFDNTNTTVRNKRLDFVMLLSTGIQHMSLRPAKPPANNKGHWFEHAVIALASPFHHSLPIHHPQERTRIQSLSLLRTSTFPMTFISK